MFQIDQTGLAAGSLGVSRTDGLSTGATVTVTYVGTGTFRARLLWVPPGDVDAVSSLAQSGVNPKIWTFTPTANVPGTYRIEGIENENTARERREIRTFSVRTPAGLVIPAYGERIDPLAHLINAPGATGPTGAALARSENNAIDFPSAELSGLPWAGSWRSYAELAGALTPQQTQDPGLIELLDMDRGVAMSGSNLAAWVGVCGHVARPITADMVIGTNSAGRRALFFNGSSQGLILEIPELKYISNQLVFLVQSTSDAPSSGSHCLINLWQTEGSTSVLSLRQEGAVMVGRANNAAGTVITTADPWGGLSAENIFQVARNSAGSLLYSFRDGEVMDSVAIDALTPTPSSTTVSIGCSFTASGGGSLFFEGVIRRIAIYSVANTATIAAQSLARNARYKGR